MRRGDTLDLGELELATVHPHVSCSTSICMVHNCCNLPVYDSTVFLLPQGPTGQTTTYPLPGCTARKDNASRHHRLLRVPRYRRWSERGKKLKKKKTAPALNSSVDPNPTAFCVSFTEPIGRCGCLLLATLSPPRHRKGHAAGDFVAALKTAWVYCCSSKNSISPRCSHQKERDWQGANKRMERG